MRSSDVCCLLANKRLLCRLHARAVEATNVGVRQPSFVSPPVDLPLNGTPPGGWALLSFVRSPFFPVLRENSRLCM